MNTISVIIITKNEASHIETCLKSVTFAQEIIVLDSGSEDNTVELAKKYTSKVYQVDWPGFGPQKNRALKLASCEWVLTIDADEMVTKKLKEEICLVTQQSLDINGYYIPRVSKYCQQIMRHGDWKNDYCLLLFRKNKGKFTDDIVHEKLIVEGKLGKLKSILLHDSFTNLEEVLEKINSYSTLSASMKHKAGKKSSLSTALIHAVWSFFRGYILKGGFLDGKRGFMLAVSNAEGCYYRYVKLMLLNE